MPDARGPSVELEALLDKQWTPGKRSVLCGPLAGLWLTFVVGRQ